MKNELYVKDRLFKRNMPKGQVFRKPGLTIPGQDITPAEMVRQFVVNKADGSRANSIFYSDINYHQYMQMDEMEKQDHLRRIKQTIEENKTIISDYKRDYQEQQKILQESERAEATSESKNKAATKTNDDASNATTNK